MPTVNKKTLCLKGTTYIGVTVFMIQAFIAVKKLINPPYGTKLSYKVEKTFMHPTIDILPEWKGLPSMSFNEINSFSSVDYMKVL